MNELFWNNLNSSRWNSSGTSPSIIDPSKIQRAVAPASRTQLPKMKNLNKHLKMCLAEEEHFLLSSARKSPSSADWPLSLLCREIGFWIVTAIGAGCPLLLPSTSAHPSIAPGIGLNSKMWETQIQIKTILFALFPSLIHPNVYFCLMYFWNCSHFLNFDF